LRIKGIPMKLVIVASLLLAAAGLAHADDTGMTMITPQRERMPLQIDEYDENGNLHVVVKMDSSGSLFVDLDTISETCKNGIPAWDEASAIMCILWAAYTGNIHPMLAK
jgi:hypothetical protein